MKRLLAVAICEDWVGDWYQVRGDEREAIAYPVLTGERVMLEVERRGGATEYILLLAEPVVLDIEGWLRYRVVKRCNGAMELSQTTVELITNGSSSSRSGNSDHTEHTDRVSRDQGA